MFPKWFRKDGELKLFQEKPVDPAWEPAGGHYDFALGVWIDDDPLDHDGDGKAGGSKSAPGDLEALRVEYKRVMGKRPFNGWDADTLKEKMAAK